MRNVQYVTTVKKQAAENVTFLILAANKKNSLKEYENATYIEYQIKEIKKVFSKSEIIVVTGLENNKINKLKSNFRIVENVNHFDSGEFEQIRIGIQNAETDNIYIVPDNHTNFNMQFSKKSKVYLSKKKEGNPGCIYNEYVENISYGLPNEINKVFFLTEAELEIAKKYLAEQQKTKYKITSFEFINELINKGAKFKAVNI